MDLGNGVEFVLQFQGIETFQVMCCPRTLLSAGDHHPQSVDLPADADNLNDLKAEHRISQS
jgi:hypothetical protein